MFPCCCAWQSRAGNQGAKTVQKVCSFSFRVWCGWLQGVVENHDSKPLAWLARIARTRSQPRRYSQEARTDGAFLLVTLVQLHVPSSQTRAPEKQTVQKLCKKCAVFRFMFWRRLVVREL